MVHKIYSQLDIHSSARTEASINQGIWSRPQVAGTCSSMLYAIVVATSGNYTPY